MSDDPPLDLWWAVPGCLAGMSMPFMHPERPHTSGAGLDAYEDDLPALWRAGVRAIVCLLNMPGAAITYTAAGFDFLLLPVRDGAAPTCEQCREFITYVGAQRELGHPVAVHCEAGVGRTGTLLAAWLIEAGITLEAAVAQIRAQRPGAIETPEQYRFLRNLAAAAA